MPQIRIQLLGDFDVVTETGLRPRFRTTKAKALFAYLALKQGESVSRSKLAALLWSDREDKQARRSLRQALSALRSTLNPIVPSSLLTTDGNVALDSNTTVTDVAAFVSVSCLNDPHSLQAAADLYRGEFFEGFEAKSQEFDDWIFQGRQTYRDIAIHVLSRLLGKSLSNDHYEAAIQTGRKLLELDPFREDTHRTLMKIYASSGQSAKALHQYKNLSVLLRRELDVDPERETVALADQVGRSRRICSMAGKRDFAQVSEKPFVRPLPRDLSMFGQPPRANSHRLHLAVIGTVFAAILLGTGAYTFHPHLAVRRENPAPIAAIATTDTRPTIAVLPFAAMSADVTRAISPDGISEDIITDLAGLPGLKVIARSSSFQFRGNADVREVGRKLNAKYVLEGSVRQVGSTYRVSAQLIDTNTGHHIWAGRYDRSTRDMVQLQDRLTSSIVEALALRIGHNELGGVDRNRSANFQAHQAYVMGKGQFSEQTPTSLVSAIGSFKQALEFDPNFAQAEAALADAYLFAYVVNWSNLAGLPDRGDVYQMAVSRAKNALLAGNPPALAHTVLAKAVYFSRARTESKYKDAVAGAQRAIVVDPNASDAFLGLGQILVRGGEPERAIAQLELARNLDPSNAGFVEFNLALAYFNMERFSQAAEHVEQSLEYAPEGYSNWTLALVIYIELGKEEKARRAFDQARKLRVQQGKGLLNSDQPPGAGTFFRLSDEARLRKSMSEACKKFGLGYDI